MWGDFERDVLAQLQSSLGDGLISFLWTDRERRLITKSPSVRNIDMVFTFFPQARLILLVRDGRSVVESCMATFGWEFERAARSWAKAAAAIRRFEATHTDRKDQYLIVRYEDLVDDVRGSLSGILRFLDLEEAGFDYDAAENLPVRGSSFYLGPGRSSVHWDPVEKGSDFAPKERWQIWTATRHERYAWIAGDQARYFGYGSVAPSRGRVDVMRNVILDWRWRTKNVARTTIYRARVRLGTASRPLRQRLGLVAAKP
jgi:hypothetical protein